MTTQPDETASSPTSEKSVDQSVTAPSSQPFWRQFLTGQRENIRVLVIALIIALFMRFFIAEPRFIPSNSMEPTLHIGDRLLVDKISYRFHPPHVGDIVVFQPPPQLREYGYTRKQAFIKRIIATPGQTITVTQQQVLVDSKPLQESYILESPAYDMPPVTVPLNTVFVMGDNRNDSNDSHVWGFLPQDNIIGPARFRFWPFSRVGRVGRVG